MRFGITIDCDDNDFKKTRKFFKKIAEADYMSVLRPIAEEGLNALQSMTPRETGVTANSWYYTIKKTKSGITISYNNSNIQNGVPIAIILQYGHGTGTGGWVEGRDYINPAIQPVFDKMADKAWKEVQRL